MFFDPKLWQLTEGVRHRIAAAVAVGVLASFVGVARLALLGWTVAMIFKGATFSQLLWPVILVAVAMIVRGALEHWRNVIAHTTAARVQEHVRMRLYQQLSELGPAYFGLERTGDVLISLVDGVEQLETWFGQYLPQLFVAAITPFVVFIFAAFLDLPLAATMLVFAAITLLAPSIFHKWDSANSMRRSKAYRAFAAEFLDSIQGLATLKAFGQGRERGKLLAQKAKHVFESTMWVLATNSLTRGITDTGLAVGTAAILALGAWRVTNGQMSLDILLIFLMVGIEAFRPQRDLRSLLHQGMMGQAAAVGVISVLEAKPAVAAATDAEPLPDDAIPTVQFEDVHFAYPGAKSSVHNGLNIDIQAGERVGFVGTSGAGKSSIVKQLLRFYDPDSGSIKVAGRDLKRLRPDDLYSLIAVVNQDTYLFHGTVEDNLRVGKPDATVEELHEAARAANAHEFISRLPEGYDTVVGERGIRLSGGQRQRVAIARALLRDAPILILDEALSAVDAQNEAVIQDALDRLMVGRTTLIFAHRLSSIIGADRILVLNEGRVVDSGSHQELINKPGTYANLMGSQAREQSQAQNDVTPELTPQSAAEDSSLMLGDQSAQMEPTDAILRAEGMTWMGAFRELLVHVKSHRIKLGAVFVFGVTRVIALIAIGILGGLAVASLKRGDPYGHYLIWLAVVAPVAGIVHWLESWLAHDMAFRMLSDMRVDLYNKLERLSPAYLVRRRTGDLVGMATNDVELVEYFFAHTVAPAFVAVLVPACVVATLSWFGWQMALALLPFLAIVALSPFFARHRLDRLGSKAREALGDLNAHVVDSLQGLGETIAFRNVEARGEELRERMTTHERLRLPFFNDLSFQTSLLEIATGLGGLAVVWTGAHLVGTGQLEAALLPVLTILAMAAFLPISEIAHIGRQLADTLGSTRRLYAVHNEQVPVTDGPIRSAPKADGGVAVSFESASFSYFDNDRLALDDVSFDIEPGTTVALVGSSGAGKTTVAHLMMRFWDPQSGSVVMGGHDLKEFDLDILRQQIALVSQDTYLFNETLRSNILLARPDANDEELMAAVDNAALTDFVAALPEGLDTRVGERGVRLSGGQRQRVAIARAFLKDAPLLILDEATSHLDAVNEQAVRTALHTLMRDRTTVVIAHRLSTIRDADKIVVLDQGRVAESGDHETLVAHAGIYARLVRHQMTSRDEYAAG